MSRGEAECGAGTVHSPPPGFPAPRKLALAGFLMPPVEHGLRYAINVPANAVHSPYIFRVARAFCGSITLRKERERSCAGAGLLADGAVTVGVEAAE